MRQEILVGLIVATLITNVVLGVELYNVVHRPVTSGSVMSTSYVGTTTSTISFTSHNGTQVSGQFSYEFIYKLHVKKEGKYLVTVSFVYPDEVVLIYLPDGKTITLTPESPEGLTHLKKGEVTLKILVSGVYYGTKPSPDQVFKSLNLSVISYESSD